MNYEQGQDDEFALSEKIANVILIFLLLVRLVDQYIPLWIFGAIPDWYRHWYTGIGYILTAAIVWLNRHRLAALNIDRPFMIILILGGVFHAFLLNHGVGTFVGITTGLIFFAYQTNQLAVNHPVPYPRGTRLLIFLTILLALAPVILFQLKLKTSLDLNTFITTFSGILVTNLAVIIFEEVLFRGALWAGVRSLGLGEQAAFYAQAILFWISHHGFLFLPNPYLFWVSIPIVAILLGLITWRSKSLTPSTIGHFSYNFISQLLVRIFE